jgi:hypothetical protein
MIDRSFLFAALVAASLAAGCQSAANSNKPANANSANTNTANSAANTASKTPESTTTELSQATPTDAYKTAWAVREKKDVAGTKRVMSKEILDFLADIAKDEKKTLDDQIKEIFEQPQAKTAEARNEKITGNTAQLEYLDEKGEWKTMDFVKEDGLWKMTLAPKDKLNKMIDEQTNKPK